jgi:hypothetical protein
VRLREKRVIARVYRDACSDVIGAAHTGSGSTLVFTLPITQVDPPSAARIFAHDALQPFYIFQYFSVVLWAFEDYYLYSGIVLLITMGSIVANVWSQYRERKRMAELAYHVEDVTGVCVCLCACVCVTSCCSDGLL